MFSHFQRENPRKAFSARVAAGIENPGATKVLINTAFSPIFAPSPITQRESVDCKPTIAPLPI